MTLLLLEVAVSFLYGAVMLMLAFVLMAVAIDWVISLLGRFLERMRRR